MSMSFITKQAEDFAREKHAHLFRPNRARQPIVEHLAEVAYLVENAGGSDNGIAAAWLHDVVEDTETTIQDIEVLFGKDISLLVDGLTDPPHFSGLPLSQRKPMQAERLLAKSSEIKLVKLCDQISNVSIVYVDPPIDWAEEKSLSYVTGAKLIADVCLGICEELDKKFLKIYEQAVDKYNRV